MKNVKFIAFYLPQYHPIPENNLWYGEGFTEWTNVAKGKPLFRGHYQPHIPADLGFYDLRLPETRREQAALAQKYGISAFCYWDYWFGGGKRLLDMPIKEVLNDKKITLPFCIAWANHSWEKKMWDKNSKNEIIAEQKYLGQKDYSDYFYTLLPLFKDERYFRVGGKLFFAIYHPLADDSLKDFIKLWRSLAKKERIGDFYFVGHDSACRNKDKILEMGFDSIYDDNVLNIHHCESLFKKVFQAITRKLFHTPTVFEYKKAANYMLDENSSREDVIPVIAPNWDHSPRSKTSAFVLKNCEPLYFKKLVEKSISVVSQKNIENQLVIVKAWNEWGEGNHLEPDLKYGKGYLEAIKESLDKNDNKKD